LSASHSELDDLTPPASQATAAATEQDPLRPGENRPGYARPGPIRRLGGYSMRSLEIARLM